MSEKPTANPTDTPTAGMDVVLAHPDGDVLDRLAAEVPEPYSVRARCTTADELRRTVRARRPGLVVTGIDFPDGSGLDAMIELGRDDPLPAVIVTEERSLALVEKAMHDHVMAYLVLPVRPKEVEAAIVLARGRFEELQSLHEEVADLRTALDNRKVIERAKGVIMAERSCTEHEAYARIRTIAQSTRRKLVDVADEILRDAADGEPA